MSVEIIEQIHKGRNNIFTVKYNGKVCVLKKAKKSSHANSESLKRQLERIKFWRRHKLSKIKAIRYHNGILKTYIRGKTLNKIVDKDKHFFSENSKELKALKKFVELLIKSGYFIHDMKMPNLVYSEGKIQIIDSGPVYKRSNKSSLKKEYQKILYIKWSKLLDSSKERKYLKKFLRMRI
jgi:tRNA A-37 threonylcarbamoyl transferase component Bud32